MKFITVSNRSHPGLELYKQSAALCGIQPHILGMGDERPLGHDSGKFGVKLWHVHNFLAQLGDKTELVLFTDAWDIVFVDSADLIERKARALLKENNAKAIFGAEKYQSPKDGYPYPPQKRAFPFLNSGVYVGQAQDLLTLLVRFRSWPVEQQLLTDDQEYFVAEYFSKSGIELDHGCLLFACMLHSGAFVHEQRVVMPHSHTMPSILHFQGYEKNILPFVAPSLRHLAAPLQQYNRKNLVKRGLETLGQVMVPQFANVNNFYRGLLMFVLVITLVIIGYIK